MFTYLPKSFQGTSHLPLLQLSQKATAQRSTKLWPQHEQWGSVETGNRKGEYFLFLCKITEGSSSQQFTNFLKTFLERPFRIFKTRIWTIFFNLLFKRYNTGQLVYVTKSSCSLQQQFCRKTRKVDEPVLRACNLQILTTTNDTLFDQILQPFKTLGINFSKF